MRSHFLQAPAIERHGGVASDNMCGTLPYNNLSSDQLWIPTQTRRGVASLRISRLAPFGLSYFGAPEDFAILETSRHNLLCASNIPSPVHLAKSPDANTAISCDGFRWIVEGFRQPAARSAPPVAGRFPYDLIRQLAHCKRCSASQLRALNT